MISDRERRSSTLVLKRHAPAPTRVVESNRVRRERRRIERAASPTEHLVVLLVMAVEDGVQEVGVAGRAAHVFRRACASPVNTTRVRHAGDACAAFLERHSMPPGVTEVVEILANRSLRAQVLDEWSRPTGECRPLLGKFVVGDPDAHHRATGLRDAKLVEVRVLPAHRILNRHMEIPERVAGRHLNAPPHAWLDVVEDDFESQNAVVLGNLRESRSTRRLGVRPGPHLGCVIARRASVVNRPARCCSA